MYASPPGAKLSGALNAQDPVQVLLTRQSSQERLLRDSMLCIDRFVEDTGHCGQQLQRVQRMTSLPAARCSTLTTIVALCYRRHAVKHRGLRATHAASRGVTGPVAARCWMQR